MKSIHVYAIPGVCSWYHFSVTVRYRGHCDLETPGVLLAVWQELSFSLRSLAVTFRPHRVLARALVGGLGSAQGSVPQPLTLVAKPRVAQAVDDGVGAVVHQVRPQKDVHHQELVGGQARVEAGTTMLSDDGDDEEGEETHDEDDGDEEQHQRRLGRTPLLAAKGEIVHVAPGNCFFIRGVRHLRNF